MVQTIPLTRGKFAVIDDEDFEWVSNYKWQCEHNGYVARTINVGNKNIITVRLHRLIMRANAKQEVDHIDGNKLDNRRSNLRFASKLDNARNRRKESTVRGTTSRFKGVSLNKARSKWMAYININKKRTHLGYFDDEEDAARAYDAAARKHYGEFAWVNLP